MARILRKQRWASSVVDGLKAVSAFTLTEAVWLWTGMEFGACPAGSPSTNNCWDSLRLLTQKMEITKPILAIFCGN